jgi:hypothetical protein
MSNIVKFPGKTQEVFAADHLVVEPMDAITPMQSAFDFTCVSCQNHTSLQLNNAVFKNVEIFCSRCGAGWKITNPVFKSKQARSN